MLRLFFTSRWMGYLALTIVFAIIASLFGLWQWDRRGQAVEAMDRVENNYDRTPVSLEDFVPVSDIVTVADEWTPLLLRGTFVIEDQVLVRTRPRAGQVGFEVLVPFRTSTDTVLVNRGWVSTGEETDFPDLIPAPPTGVVTVEGRLKLPEPELRGRGAPEGQVATINMNILQPLTTDTVREDFFVIVSSETPAPDRAPLRGERPFLDEGPHLSYTFQWFIFALMAFVGYGWLLRQDYRILRGLEPPRKSQRSDAEEEDALLEKSRL